MFGTSEHSSTYHALLANELYRDTNLLPCIIDQRLVTMRIPKLLDDPWHLTSVFLNLAKRA